MKISQRDKKFLIAGAIALCLFFLIKYGVFPLYDQISFKKRDIALKEKTLKKYMDKIEKASELQGLLIKQASKIQKIEQSLLKGGTTSLAAADIQKIANKIARDSDVSIKSVKVMEAGEKGDFVTIPIQVTFESDLTKTSNFIQKIENNRKLLTIPELKIRVKNRRKGGAISVTLQIVGFMKKKKEAAS